MKNPFRYFNSSPDIIRLAVMMYVRYPLSLRQVEDLLHERGIDICHETVRFWWNRFGPMFDSLGAFSNFWALGTGKVMICAVPNARVATRAFPSPATVKVPLVMALDTYFRDALSNAR